MDEMVVREIEIIHFKIKDIKVNGEERGIKRVKGIVKGVVRGMSRADFQKAYHQHKESTVSRTILK